MTNNYFGIVAAGGLGTRFRSVNAKQYIEINGRSILEISISSLTDSIDFSKLVVVVPKLDIQKCQFLKKKFKKIEIISGGESRCESVFLGLEFLRSFSKEDDWCLVHDAARPCLEKKDILELVNSLEDSSTGGILGTPVTDTLKRVGEHQLIQETVDRSDLWKAFTPQMFRYGILYDSLLEIRKDGINVSDEAQALEKLGKNIRIIKGSSDNIKVTFPEDIKKVKTLLTYLRDEDNL